MMTQTTYYADVLSQGPKGFMVRTRNASGQTVTRHLSPAGEGRHPEDTLPTLRTQLASAVAEARTFVREATLAIAGIELLLMDPSADARVKGVQAKRLPALREALEKASGLLAGAEGELAGLPPLMVRYTFGAPPRQEEAA